MQCLICPTEGVARFDSGVNARRASPTARENLSTCHSQPGSRRAFLSLPKMRGMHRRFAGGLVVTPLPIHVETLLKSFESFSQRHGSTSFFKAHAQAGDILGQVSPHLAGSPVHLTTSLEHAQNFLPDEHAVEFILKPEAAQIVFCKSSGGQAEGEMDGSMLR